MNTPRTEMNDIAKALGDFVAAHEAACNTRTIAEKVAALDIFLDAANALASQHGPTLAALVADGGWIPVNDALPIREETFIGPSHQTCAVIVWDGYQVGEAVFEAGAYGPNGFWGDWNSYGYLDKEKITHWRPLPPPPNAARAGGG